MFFITAEHIILLLKYAIATYIPDITFKVQLQLARQDYLVDKHIFGVRDVEYSSLKRTTSQGVNGMEMDEDERTARVEAQRHGMNEGGDWRVFNMGSGGSTNCQLQVSNSYAEMLGLSSSSGNAVEAGTTLPGISAIGATGTYDAYSTETAPPMSVNPQPVYSEGAGSGV